jgi:hypothetical protein
MRFKRSDPAVSLLALASEFTKVKAPAELLVAEAGISVVTTGGGAGGVTGAGSELLSPQAANSTVAAPIANNKGLGE